MSESSRNIAKSSDKQDKGLLDDSWIRLQSKGFTAWANSHLVRRDLELSNVHDLTSNGLMLVNLLEILSGRKFSVAYEKNPKTHIQLVINMNACLAFMEKLEVKMVTFSPETCLDQSDVKPKLSILWALIRKFHIVSDDDNAGANPNAMKAELLKWVQEVTASYDGVKIENFTSSWKNGLGFCALVNFALPDLVDYASLEEDEVEKNLTNVFEIARKELEIPQLLHPSDVAEGMLDEHVVMTYVSYFRNSAAMQEKRRALQKKLEEERLNAAGLTANLEALRVEVAELKEKLATEEVKVAELSTSKESLETSLQVSRDRALALEDEVSKITEEKNQIDQRAQALDEFGKGKEAELAEEKNKTASLEEVVASLRAEVAELKETLATTTTNLETTTNERDSLKAQVAELQSLMSQTGDENAKALADMVQKNSDLTLNLSNEKTQHSAARDRIASLSSNLEQTSADLTSEKAITADLRKNVADLESELRDQKDQLALLKASCEMRVLTYPKPATDIAVIRARIADINDETKVEEQRLIQLREKLHELTNTIKDLAAKTDVKSRKKLEETELARRQTELEYTAFRNLRAVILAELWDTQMMLLSSDPRREFNLGTEIAERMDVVSLQLRRAVPTIQELRQVQADLQGELAVQQKDMEGVFALMKGENLLKYNKKGTGKPQKRFFFLHIFREVTIFWSEEEASGVVAGSSNALASSSGKDFRQGILVNVHEGPSEEVLKAQGNLPENLASLSFHLDLSDRRLDLIAPSRGAYEQWTSGLRKVLTSFKRGVIGGTNSAQMRLDLILSKSLAGKNFDYAVEKATLEAEAFKRQQDTKKQLEDVMASLKSKNKTNESAAYRSRSISGSQFKDPNVKKVMARIFVYERLKSAQEFVSIYIEDTDTLDKVTENVVNALNKSLQKPVAPQLLVLSYKVANVKNSITPDTKLFKLMKELGRQTDFTVWVDYK